IIAVSALTIDTLPLLVRDFTSNIHRTAIRSSNVNKPDAEMGELKGDISGGSIFAGV
ncbi:hypothetical protein EDB19DRAFT_1585911, partial [Suillus lakei]